MHDAKQAIRYFKANANAYGIDTSLVFIGGESAGAATSMMAAFIDKQSEMATYPMANPSDPIGSMSNLNVSNDVKATMCLCGLMLDTLAIESPTDPAILWTHGTEDNFVPISLAFNIVLRAVNVGVPIVAKAYEGAIHCPWYFGNPNWETYMDSTIMDITNFLYPQVIEIIIDVDEEFKIDDIPIYPNPFESLVAIDLSAIDSRSSIKLLSSSGKLLLHKSYEANRTNVELNLENVSPGLYFVLIEYETKRTFKKVIKY